MTISSQWESPYHTDKMASFKMQQSLLFYMGHDNGWGRKAILHQPGMYYPW